MIREIILALLGHTGSVIVKRRQFLPKSDTETKREDEEACEIGVAEERIVGYHLDASFKVVLDPEREIINEICMYGFKYSLLQHRVQKALSMSIHAATTLQDPSGREAEGRSVRGGEREVGLYVRTLYAGIDDILSLYRSTIVQLERSWIACPPLTLTSIISTLSYEYGALFNALIAVTDEVEACQDKHVDLAEKEKKKVDASKQNAPPSLLGCHLLDILHEYVESGNPLLAHYFTYLYGLCWRLLVMQLQGWLMQGKLRDPYREFFIQEAIATNAAASQSGRSSAIPPHSINSTSAGSEWKIGADESQVIGDRKLWASKYRVAPDKIPSFITPESAALILFCGKAVKFLSPQSKSLSHLHYLNEQDSLVSFSSGASLKHEDGGVQTNILLRHLQPVSETLQQLMYSSQLSRYREGADAHEDVGDPADENQKASKEAIEEDLILSSKRAAQLGTTPSSAWTSTSSSSSPSHHRQRDFLGDMMMFEQMLGKAMSSITLDCILDKHIFLSHLRACKDIFLLGNRELVDKFLNKAGEKVIGRFTPTDALVAELNFMQRQAISSVEVEDDLCDAYSFFQFQVHVEKQPSSYSSTSTSTSTSTTTTTTSNASSTTRAAKSLVLHYSPPWPLDLLLTPTLVKGMADIHTRLVQLQYAQRQLQKCWLVISNKIKQHTKEMYDSKERRRSSLSRTRQPLSQSSLHIASCLRAEMIFFLSKVEYFLQVETVECDYTSLCSVICSEEGDGFYDVQKALNAYLAGMMQFPFLSNITLSRCLRHIIDAALNLSEIVGVSVSEGKVAGSGDSFNARVEKEGTGEKKQLDRCRREFERHAQLALRILLAAERGENGTGRRRTSQLVTHLLYNKYFTQLIS